MIIIENIDLVDDPEKALSELDFRVFNHQFVLRSGLGPGLTVFKKAMKVLYF